MPEETGEGLSDYKQLEGTSATTVVGHKCSGKCTLRTNSDRVPNGVWVVNLGQCRLGSVVENAQVAGVVASGEHDNAAGDAFSVRRLTRDSVTAVDLVNESEIDCVVFVPAPRRSDEIECENRSLHCALCRALEHEACIVVKLHFEEACQG